MPCIAPTVDYSDAKTGLQRHLDALEGSLHQLKAAIQNRPTDYAVRFRRFEKVIVEDLRMVQADLGDYEEYQNSLPAARKDGSDCQTLVTKLWEVMAEINSQLETAESYL